MACPEGLEPPTCCLEGNCSIQLSYGQPVPVRGWLVGATRFERATYCSQSSRATKLRYAPMRPYSRRRPPPGPALAPAIWAILWFPHMNAHRPHLRLAALILSLAAAVGAAAQGVPQDLPAITLQAGIHNIRAAVAITPDQRQTGLMFRREMAQHEGMLFVFEEPSPQCFWMKNTLLPLSIAFLADDGSVVNIDEMKPQTLDSHCSTRPVRFVLEMNQGWFTKRGIKPGSKIAGAPFAVKPASR